MDDMEQKIQERIKENESEKPSVVIFGRDVTKIPCFKSSVLTGVVSGMAIGILTFMFTSRPQLASHLVVSSFGVITFGCYSVCRYQLAKEKAVMDRIKTLMNEAKILENVERDAKIEEAAKLIDV